MQPNINNMVFSNTETIPGMSITQSLGVVTGSTVRAKNVFKDIGAAFKNIAGGEIVAYTELLQESRNEALFRMLNDAAARGANAVSMFDSQLLQSPVVLQNCSLMEPQWSHSEVIFWQKKLLEHSSVGSLLQWSCC